MPVTSRTRNAVAAVLALALSLGVLAAPATAASSSTKDKRGDVAVTGKVAAAARPDISKVTLTWHRKKRMSGPHSYDLELEVALARPVLQGRDISAWVALGLKGVRGRYVLATGVRPGGAEYRSDIYRKVGSTWQALGCTVLSTSTIKVTKNKKNPYRVGSVIFRFDSACLRAATGKRPTSIRAKVTINHVKRANKHYTADTATWTKRVKRG